MKKIMFNDRFGLTQAVLEGRKTMTRRVIKDKDGLYADIRCMRFSHLDDKGNAILRSSIGFAKLQPAYKVGEVVAVAQSYKDAGYYPMGTKDEPGWNNKMFVRADLMPHQIRITDIRVERIQDISDEDCIKEGVEKGYIGYYINGLKTKDWEKESHVEKNGKTYKLFPTPREAFAALINKISGKGTWESNPWEFVYEFELVK